MIILEGPDRCGKTTVAKALRKLLPHWSYRHHTNPWSVGCRPFPYFSWFVAYAPCNVIVDRCHLSEWAYGYTYRDGKGMTDHEWRLLELAFLSRGAQVLALDDRVQDVRQRWGKGEMYPFDLTQQQNLRSHYGQAYRETVLPIGHWRLPELLKYTHSIAQDAELQAIKLQNTLPVATLGTGFTGPGGYVVVVDTPGLTEPEGNAAGFPLDRGFASDFWWSALDEVGVDWGKGYFTNASAFRDVRALNDTLEVLRPRTVLCLGNNATKLTIRAWRRPQSVVSVEHPSHVRRFHRHNHDAWQDEICQCLSDWRTE